MPTMREPDRQVADRPWHAASKRSGVSRAAERTNVPQRTADTVPVGFLTTHEQHQDVTVLSVHGEVDLGTAPVLREAILPVLERQTGRLVVDLSEVPFMDSTGVHVLVDTLRRLEPHNRPLAIVCREAGAVHRLLTLVGLLDALTVHRSRESAVIGGDDVLRSEPGSNSRPSDTGTLTQALPSARPTAGG